MDLADISPAGKAGAGPAAAGKPAFEAGRELPEKRTPVGDTSTGTQLMGGPRPKS